MEGTATEPAHPESSDSGDDGEGGHHLLPDLGGRARTTVVVLLAAVLGLQAADTGAIGALAAPLESAFRIDNTLLGLLVTATTMVGVVVTLPFGMLADRSNRSVLLQVVILGWAAATALSALSTSYAMLLVTRLALGGVIAASGPAISSLVGDLFPPEERSRLYSFVLTGELIGAGIGILVAGGVSAVAGWRLAIGILALPALVLAWAVRRYLPEPARGGQGYLHVGDEEILTAEDVGADASSGTPDEPVEPSELQIQAEEQGIEPLPGTVLAHPGELGTWAAVRYVLRIRTNVALILASGLGYFFFGGVETFAELYFRDRFGVGQSEAAILFVFIAGGGLAGVLISGRSCDALIRRGYTPARLVVAAVAFVVTFVLFVPGVLFASLGVALPILVVAAAALGGINAPMDTARLDVLPSRLWGRAEAVRTALRQLLQGLAPLLFGLVSTAFGAVGAGIGAGVDTGATRGSLATGHGLELTFVVLSVPLIVAGVVLWLGRHAYLRDMVAAARSDRQEQVRAPA